MVRFLRHYGTLMGMAAIVLVFWALLPDTFMTTRNWLNITQQVSMLTVVAVAMTVVMVVGDFDLSVGSMASLSGIVAAVLGVVNTMGSVGQPPAVLGGLIASALVGTFLGILLAYGVVEPLGGLLEQKSEDSAKELQCIKSTLLASMQGYNPSTAIEFGRKVLFSTERPTFLELENHVRKK